MTDAAYTSRWVRRFVLLGAGFLVVWQTGELAGIDRRSGTVLALLGFVFHTVFGKAYSLVPSYFDRDLATARLLVPQLLASASGTVLLALDPELDAAWVGPVGAGLWVLGVTLFLSTLGWTIRDNLTGGETGTGKANADRRAVDRLANGFVPVAMAYLALGTYALLAAETGLPLLFDGYAPRAFHLLAAGTGALMVFALGFRLLPRFLVARAPLPLAAVVLPAGALGPLLLAWGLPAGRVFRVGAVLETLAVCGFALAFWLLFARSDRRRVGFYGVLACTVAGFLGVALGLTFAFGDPTADLFLAHRRLNLLGFLGLAIVGVSYQFYPPGIATFRGGGDRTALAAIGLLAGGLLVEVAGLVLGGGFEPLVDVGRGTGLAGALVHLFLLLGLFRQRYG